MTKHANLKQEWEWKGDEMSCKTQQNNHKQPPHKELTLNEWFKWQRRAKLNDKKKSSCCRSRIESRKRISSIMKLYFRWRVNTHIKSPTKVVEATTLTHNSNKKAECMQFIWVKSWLSWLSSFAKWKMDVYRFYAHASANYLPN